MTDILENGNFPDQDHQLPFFRDLMNRTRGKIMNSEKNGTENQKVRSIASMKTCGSSERKTNSLLRDAPVEIESQSVLGDFLLGDEAGIRKALQDRIVKAADLRGRVVAWNVLDALDAVLLDMVEIEHHAVVDHLGDVGERAAVYERLSFSESILIDPVGVGFCHRKAMVSGLYNKCYELGYKTANQSRFVIQI